MWGRSTDPILPIHTGIVYTALKGQCSRIYPWECDMSQSWVLAGGRRGLCLARELDNACRVDHRSNITVILPEEPHSLLVRKSRSAVGTRHCTRIHLVNTSPSEALAGSRLRHRTEKQILWPDGPALENRLFICVTASVFALAYRCSIQQWLLLHP
jgi:hypothetical protein